MGPTGRAIVGTVLGILLSKCEIGSAADAHAPATTGLSQSAKRARACRLSPHAYPKNVTDESGYARWVRERVESFSQRIQSAADESTRIEFLLILANFRLARQTEPAATRWLLGDHTQETCRELAQAAGEAKTEIRKARDLISKLEKASPPPRVAGKTLNHWRQLAGQLSALAFAMEMVGRTTKDLDPLTELEPLAKKNNMALGAAANLWRIAVIRQAGQGQRIVDILEPVLAKPALLPYSFFQRLLHCQMLVDQGRYAVATALALRMEAETENWFDKRLEPEAKRAIVLMQIAIAEKWADRLSNDKIPEHAERRRASARRLAEQFSHAKDAPVYRLGLAIPILVESPEPPPPSKAPRLTTQVGTTPTPGTSMSPVEGDHGNAASQPCPSTSKVKHSNRSDPPPAKK